jgi:sensor c-di-GMP phosphodiesterase-like protein
MQPMSEGMDLDQGLLIQVLQNKLAQSGIREAQMETGIQQLLAEKQVLTADIEALRAIGEDVEGEG